MRFVLGATIAVFGICLLDLSRAVWWSLGTQIPLASDPAKKAMMCLVTPELNLRQKRECQRYPDLMPHVAKGALYAIKECQFQFRARRWNCSGVPESGSMFVTVMKKEKINWNTSQGQDTLKSLKEAKQRQQEKNW